MSLTELREMDYQVMDDIYDKYVELKEEEARRYKRITK